MGKDIQLTEPPIFLGNNIIQGVIFIKATKKIQKGSINSLRFNSNFKLIKKLNAHNLRPRKISE